MIGDDMAGIDKIIAQIEADTEKVCDSILSDAQSKADQILSSAEKQAEEIISDGKEKTAARVVDIKNRGDSAADLEEKRVMLHAKREIISKMLNEGLRTAKTLPDDEYFALISGMVEKYSQPEDGVICFGDKDIKRLPTDYLTKLNEVSKGKITLSEDPAPIEAGFILKYGGVEQNCSFDAVFAGESENLSDKAGRLLF